MVLKKNDQVREILLKPIDCDKSQSKVYLSENRVISGQTYYSSADADMSDFSIGFYEIIYKEVLKGKPILGQKGSLKNSEFAGDTMNSFNTIANCTPGAGKSSRQRTEKEEWPEYLRGYQTQYHCLANFWILPMEIGRTTKGKLNKSIKPISDYMDRFLQLVESEVSYNGRDREYFKSFSGWNDFVSKHFLNGYLDNNQQIELYSYFDEKGHPNFITSALQKIEQRATCIAESEYANELWEYFDELKLFY